MSDSSRVFDYNHCKMKPSSPPQSEPDDEKDLVLTNRPVTLVDYDDDDEEDDVEIIEIIEVPRPPPKKTAPPALALSKLLKKEREEQEAEEKRLKKQHNVNEIFRKKIPPPPPALSHYLEKERAEEEKMLKFKKFLSQKFPHRSKLSLDEEERLRNLYPNKMYLDQYEKFCSKFNEDFTPKNRYRNTNRKDKTRTRNETDSESTSKGGGDSTDEDSKSNTTTTTNSVKMVVPNPKFYSENKARNPPISAKTVATTYSTARKQSGSGTRDQFNEDYDFLLNGIPNDLQYRIFDYATLKPNNSRLLTNQNPAAEGFLFLKEKKDARQIHTYDNKGSTSLSRSRYFDGLSQDKDKDKDKDNVIPTLIPNSKNNLTMRKNSSFDSGNSNEAIELSVRKRPSSPSILDISAQTVDRYLPFISSTYALPALNNSKSKEITPTIVEKPPTPSPPVEKNVDELKTANIITICLD